MLELNNEVRDVDGVNFRLSDRSLCRVQQFFTERGFPFYRQNLFRFLTGQNGEHGVANLGREKRIGFAFASFGQTDADRHAQVTRLGIVREVVSGVVLPRALALAERVAGLPRKAILETKRRTQLERSHLWGFLFDYEEEVFRRALLGEHENQAALSAR